MGKSSQRPSNACLRPNCRMLIFSSIGIVAFQNERLFREMYAAYRCGRGGDKGK